MGSGLSSGNSEASAEEVANRIIDRELREAKLTLSRQLKVLLLGTQDGGKSTMLNQMRTIGSLVFDKAELESYRQLIFENLVEGAIKLLEAMEEMGIRSERDVSSLQDRIERAPDIRDGQPYPQEYLAIFQTIWNDPAVVNVLNHEYQDNELALPDNIPYFFSNLPRLFAEDFQPSNQDIIHTRARTTGIKETVFKMYSEPQHQLRIIDIGGQMGERRKWIHYFEDVTAILFLVSLSGYDTCLAEDRDENQMQDSMAIWDSVVNSQWFVKTSIVLFLNKVDIFQRKLAYSDIKHTFPDYDGRPNDVDDGKEYFKRRFLKMGARSKSSRNIYTYFTEATSTTTLKVLMTAVSDITLMDNLRSAKVKLI